VVVYVFNVRYLPVHGEGVSQILVNVIPFMNLGLSGFVIASIAARFIFPAVSLEGRTLWLLRSSPLEMSQLLWSKFWVGTLPLLVLALLLTGITNYFLGVGAFMFLLSTITITMLTLAIASLALAFGTMYPQFDTENAAQIPTSFGGLLFMMASVVLIGAVIFLEARPVFSWLNAQRAGQTLAIDADLYVPLGLALLLCCVSVLVPIRVALRRMELLES
jgi:ABC-2 type transport system permease protein